MILGDHMATELQTHLKEYITFKHSIPVASSQMLRIMAKVEIEMMAKDIIAILDKKYHVAVIPELEIFQHLLESIFENSIIRSDSQLRHFLTTIDHDYEAMNHQEVMATIDSELSDLTTMIRSIYNTELTSCYADFPRRCTEEITKELRIRNQTEAFEEISVKLKMHLKKELTKVLQKFLDGAYKTIHTQILMNMKSQIAEVKQYLK